MSNCVKCNAILEPEARFCDECGAEQPAALFCDECGAGLEPGVKFCDSCGAACGGIETPSSVSPAKTAPKPSPKTRPITQKPAEQKQQTQQKTAVFTLDLPNRTKKIKASMVNLPQNFTGYIQIPEGVEVIEQDCFKGKAITGVIFPKSLKEIKLFAFKECQLKELSVIGPEGKKIIIRNYAFVGNSTLEKITISNCEVGIRTFQGCPVSRVTISGKVDFLSDPIGFQHKRNKKDDCETMEDNLEKAYKSNGGGNGTYILTEKPVKAAIPETSKFYGCEKCAMYDDRSKRCYEVPGIPKWEKV